MASAARKGDRRALERLLRMDYERLHAICWRVLREREAAMDATQEALISISRGILRFDQRSLYTTWSYRVAANAALDELRKRQRRHGLEVLNLADREPGSPEAHEVGAEADTATIESLDIAAAVAALPTDQRSVIVLRHQLELSYAEIAAVLKIPVGTVRSRISRARQVLAEVLSAGCAEQAPHGGEPGLGNRSDSSIVGQGDRQ